MFTGNYKSGQTNLICISPEAQYFFAKCLAAILNCWSRRRLGRKKILISGWAIGERNKGKRPPVIGYPRDRAPIRIKNFVIGTISRWYQLVWLQNGLPDLFKKLKTLWDSKLSHYYLLKNKVNWFGAKTYSRIGPEQSLTKQSFKASCLGTHWLVKYCRRHYKR